ncbi:beta-carotene 15,15'-monooxygenase [Neobacillus thermocopriae]|uniref:beta-carotene 15,15'-monooxygenase n=1 Tax=Neobacillus thermocopriae TaxID=1215031 RepID=UPI002AA5906A
MYYTSFGIQLIPKDTNMIVAGSMIDLALISPLLFLAWKGRLTWKNIIFGIAGGLVFVRFFIPMEYFAPLEGVTWVGFVVEGGLIFLEIAILVSLFIQLSKIVQYVRKSSLPVLFSFSTAVNQQVKSITIIQIICSEMLMFYYAFASWRKKPPKGKNWFTLHQKSSYLSMQIMLIHAIILETAALHWWLHEKSFILSIILFVINLYSVIFFVADIQAVRHNPVFVTNDRLYLSLGLTKRMDIKWTDIDEVIVDPKRVRQKRSKNTIEFMARDFEETFPDVILKLKHPVEATLTLGIMKPYDQVAIRLDEPE